MKTSNLKKVFLGIIGLIVLVLIGMVIWYFVSISPVNKINAEEIEITIDLGSTPDNIADILKENDLIRNKTAFKIYVKLNNISDFQAGTYYLKQNMDLKSITDMLKTGIMYDQNQISITFVEGKNFREIAKRIAQHTNNTEKDVMNLLNDEEYINSLIEEYWFLDDVIKDDDIYYSLEGYLFPDTYLIESKDTKVEEIFKKMLDQMEKVLNEYKDEIENSKYTIHEILTIASIIETESVKEEDRKNVASVLYNRLESGMALRK